MKSRKLSAQRPGNRSNGASTNGSSDELTKRNVEIVKQLEEAAKQQRTNSDLVAGYCRLNFKNKEQPSIAIRTNHFGQRLITMSS